MEDINKLIGKNLLTLRKNAKLTQVELADVFNYSDKTISKWETGESLPSIEVLYDLAKFYNVTLNDLTSDNENLTKTSTEDVSKNKRMFSTKLIITLLAVSAVWLTATVVFVCLKIFAHVNYYMCFLWAVPASCVVLIVFNSLWGRTRYLFPILSILIWSCLACLQIQISVSAKINIWPVYIVGVPLQIGVILWGALVKRPKGYYKQMNNSEQNK